MRALLDPQLILVFVAVVCFAVGTHRWVTASPTAAVERRTTAVIFGAGVGALSVLLGLIIVQGITFFSVTSTSNVWVLLATAFGFLLLGFPFLVAGGYLLTLVGDLLVGFGFERLPSPINALVNLSPAAAVAAVVLLIALMVGAQSMQGRRRDLGQVWGVRYMALLVGVGLVGAVFYSDLSDHVFVLLEAYWLALLMIGLAVASPRQTEALTRRLLLVSFWLRLGVFLLQIFSRPLLLGPSLSSFAATEVDNIFRLGGFAYGANNSALTLVTLLPFGIASIQESKLMRWSTPLWLVMVAYVVYRTDTRSAWVAFVLSLFVYFVLVKEWRYVAVLGTISAIGVATMPYIWERLVRNFVETDGVAGYNSLSARIDIWTFALRAALTDTHSWLLGVGWGAKPVAWPGTLPGNWSTLHSLWVTVLVRSGLLGAVAWAAAYLDSLTHTWKAAVRSTGRSRRWLAAGVGAWVAFLFFTLTANADWAQPIQMAALIAVNSWVVVRISDEDAEQAAA